MSQIRLLWVNHPLCMCVLYSHSVVLKGFFVVSVGSMAETGFSVGYPIPPEDSFSSKEIG